MKGENYVSIYNPPKNILEDVVCTFFLIAFDKILDSMLMTMRQNKKENVTFNSMMTTMMHNKKIVITNKHKMTKMKNGKPKQCA